MNRSHAASAVFAWPLSWCTRMLGAAVHGLLCRMHLHGLTSCLGSVAMAHEGDHRRQKEHSSAGYTLQ